MHDIVNRNRIFSKYANPDLANDSAYDLGWIIILEPHNLDLELLLDPDEYVEYLAEL